MAFAEDFSVSQSASTPNIVTVTDTSTGSDGQITQRRVYVSNSDGEYLTGNGTVDYDEWLLANPSIALDILTEDTAANIRVDWCNISGTVLYSLNNNYPLSEFGKQFLFYLIQLQGLTPGIYQDTNYSGNIALFWTNIIAGDNAINYGNSLSAAQNCYNREIQMMQYQSLYF